mmetsp:Transcript_29045/g.69403  ORF Transcript_29045/g.69403 Transcript_29045/m.69403 type:complete len:240 (+) Transcript_29045:734-1453(+)
MRYPPPFPLFWLPFLAARQAIHARSFFPCQDTPGVKATYTAAVTVPDGLRALMSAIPLDDGVPRDGGLRTYRFEQKARRLLGHTCGAATTCCCCRRASRTEGWRTRASPLSRRRSSPATGASPTSLRTRSRTRGSATSSPTSPGSTFGSTRDGRSSWSARSSGGCTGRRRCSSTRPWGTSTCGRPWTRSGGTTASRGSCPTSRGASTLTMPSARCPTRRASTSSTTCRASSGWRTSKRL